MTVLYSDFDGVLHLNQVHNVDGCQELGVSGLLFKHAAILEEALGYHPEVKIVLSTSWVGAFGFEATLAYLPPRIRERMAGCTWSEPHQVGIYAMYRFSDLTSF